MDATTASLITGLAAAGVGLGSAVLSHLALRKQVNIRVQEQQLNRRHTLKAAVFPRVADATEKAWLLLHELQVEPGHVTDQDTADMIACSVWLPEKVRGSLLAAISRDGQNTSIASAQKAILEFVDSLSGET